MAERLHVTVPAALAGERADKALAELLQGMGRSVTRAEVQRWLEDGRVTRAGRLLERRTTLRAGDSLDVEVGPPPLSEAVPDPSVTFPVVYEDPHLLVIDKPAGLVVHPARGHRDGTLVNGLLARGGFELASSDARDPEGHLRPGIVHRLDKETSGLLVVAKDTATREGLKALFATHTVERAYLAIVVGAAVRATYDTGHGRHPTNRLKFTSQLDPKRERVRRAVTHVELLESMSSSHASLVRCTLETGRTHQIRVHLSERGKTPILADSLYGTRPADPRVAEAAATLGRQALHAAVLGFVHPITKETVRWESVLPADMRTALESLRDTSS